MSPDTILPIDDVGDAMLNVARSGIGCNIIDAKGILSLAQKSESI